MERTLEKVLFALRTSFVTPIARRVPLAIGPTTLTSIRLLLVVPLAGFLISEQHAAAVITYLGAVATDALDGEVARLRGVTSRVGARLDPTVDKVVHGVIFIFFWRLSPLLLSSLLTMDVLLLLVGLIVIMVRKGDVHVAGANVFGKWKFAMQTVGTLLFFLARLFSSSLILPFARIVLAVALVFAFLSSARYLRTLRQPRARETRA